MANKFENIKVKDLSTAYDSDFIPSEDYLDHMPDLQNGSYQENLPIQMVGIHNILVPIKVKQKDGGTQEVCAEITGTVSLEGKKKGINMSRIVRRLYANMDDTFSSDKICEVLEDYKRSLGSFDAHMQVKFQYRLWQDALRSEDTTSERAGGWMYYDVRFDINLNKNDEFRKVMWVDFVYSSACPCSTALSKYAALTRGKYAIPHSQRSVARIGIEYKDSIWIEDVISMCQEQLTTEVQVYVKRIDEQAFAEKNGAQPKFVEDAIRLLGNGLNRLPGVYDYKVFLSHMESLHPHNAIAVMTKGLQNSKFTPDVSFEEFESLIH